MASYERPKEMQFHTTRQEAYVEDWTKLFFREEKHMFKPLRISATLSLAISAVLMVIVQLIFHDIVASVLSGLVALMVLMIAFREIFLQVYKSIKFKEYSVDIKIDATKTIIKDSRRANEVLIYHNAIADIHCGFETDWDEKMFFYITEETAEGKKTHKVACLDDMGRDIMLALCDYSNIQKSYYMR